MDHIFRQTHLLLNPEDLGCSLACSEVSQNETFSFLGNKIYVSTAKITLCFQLTSYLENIGKDPRLKQSFMSMFQTTCPTMYSQRWQYVFLASKGSVMLFNCDDNSRYLIA